MVEWQLLTVKLCHLLCFILEPPCLKGFFKIFQGETTSFPQMFVGDLFPCFTWLVVWNMFYFSIFGNVTIPTDELHHFSEG